jgi:hypothetical protein
MARQPVAAPMRQEYARDETLDASIQQDFQDSMRPAPPAAPPAPSRPETRADRMSAAAAAMSEEQFTDAFKRQLVARDSKLAEQQFTDTFKRDLVSRDAKLTEEANTNAMIDRIRAARQTGIGDAPQLSALAQQMMYKPDGSKRPLPSREMLDKWSDIDGLAGRRRESGKHIAAPPAKPTEEQLASILGTKPAEPYDWSRHSVGVRTSPEYAEAVRDRASKEAVAAADDKPSVAATPASLQQPEEAAERPKMFQADPKAAVQAEPVPMPAKPMMNPQQRALAGKGEWRNIAKQPTLAKHYQSAAKQLGLGPMGSDAFGALSPEQVQKLRTAAHDLQQQATGEQFDDRLSDRNQAKSENIPIALATAQRLQGRGNVLIAEAAGLHDADPEKAAKHAAGTALVTQGNTKSADFWRAWQQQADAYRERQVMQAGMMYGRDGAGIVEAHIRGQQEMARARLNDQGQRDDRIAAEAGLDRRANNRADVDLALADKNITAQEIQQQRDREQRMSELKERERLHGLDQAQRSELAKLEREAAAHRQKLDLDDRKAGREAQAAQNPVPMQPAQQRAQLWEPLKAADANPDDQTPVQQHVDNFMQNLASQEGLQPQQRQIQGGQVKAWANQHVMSRWENDRLRDSDRGYIRSLAYATDADGNKTGKLKDRSTFVREMGSHYTGNNWGGMAAKLGAFYDRLLKEEQESANLTQVGIPDNPVV